ncbi:hypothetical protein Micbo1qcDRAFT_213885 [Microdochium bolleyi]|uniref:Uncharacterized protein n=1 Tax=Microdochium bolleyi TaxID=196109 RepID=A0A136IV80_9PEZI|nr:hypothetical protein Micbo1qcDRAFT_213885 [Microdochium bolleyi]
MAQQSSSSSANNASNGLGGSRWAALEPRLLTEMPKPLNVAEDGENELHVPRTRPHQAPAPAPTPMPAPAAGNQAAATSSNTANAGPKDSVNPAPKVTHSLGSSLLWAIVSGQSMDILRKIGDECAWVDPKAFKTRCMAVAPTPFTACFLHDNLDALRYLIDEVDDSIFHWLEVSSDDLIRCIDIALKNGLDDILLYLISEVNIDPGANLTFATRLAKHGMAECLHWRLVGDSVDMPESEMQGLVLLCLKKAVQADSARLPDNLAVVQCLLDLGGPGVCKSNQMLELMMIAVVSDRMKEALAMFSAWLNSPTSPTPTTPIKHSTILTLYCMVRDSDDDAGEWILETLEHRFPSFLPPIFPVDNDNDAIWSDDDDDDETAAYSSPSSSSNSDFVEITQAEAAEYAEHLRMGELQAAGLAGEIPIALSEALELPRLRAVAHEDDGYEADVDGSTL